MLIFHFKSNDKNFSFRIKKKTRNEIKNLLKKNKNNLNIIVFILVFNFFSHTLSITYKQAEVTLVTENKISSFRIL